MSSQTGSTRLAWGVGWGALWKAGLPGSLPMRAHPCPRFSALHHAALNGNTELITLLLEAQAAVDIKDNKGKAGQGPQSRGRGSRAGVESLEMERLLRQRLQTRVSLWVEGACPGLSALQAGHGCRVKGQLPTAPTPSLPAPRHAATALRGLAGAEGAHEAGAEGGLSGEHPIG